jgi:uncharacterized RDD family membrane protein YckC
MAVQAPQYAGFWIRFVAYLIDWVVMAVLSITVIGGLIYMPVMWWLKGQTLGQMALGLKVVRASDGGPIGGAGAVIRYIGLIISMIVLFIGVIWVAFEPRKRGWHDMIAGTVVIHVN